MMNNMIRTFAAFLFLVITVSVTINAQTRQTVVLKDGSRVSGTILYDSLDFLWMKVDAPQVVPIPRSEVSFLETITGRQKFSPAGKGYFIHFSASTLAGKSDQDNANLLSLHLTNGFQFSNGIRAGIGVGMEQMESPLLPLYADLNYHPFNSRVSPYLYLKAGYGFPLQEKKEDNHYWYYSMVNSKGGLLFNAGAGIALYTWQRAGVNLGIGYRYQRVSMVYRNMWDSRPNTLEKVTRYNRLQLQLGFIFR